MRSTHRPVGGGGRRPLPPGASSTACDGASCPASTADAEVTVVANTADDFWMHGLKVCPDLDTVMYTLGDGIDPDRGWGRRDETWSAKEELAAYGVEPTWFGLGDRDLATHLVRTQMLDAGFPLSEVTEALCRRWQPGVRLLPMTDDRVETHIAIADPDTPSGRRVVHFQEYWVRLRAEVPAEAVLVVGLEDVLPRPGRDRGDHRRRPRRRPAVQPGGLCRHHPRRPAGPRGPRRHAGSGRRPLPHHRRHPRARHGPPDADRDRRRGQLPPASGCTTAPGRPAGCSTAGWSTPDADDVARVREAGLACAAVPLLMTDLDATAAMAAAALDLVT